MQCLGITPGSLTGRGTTTRRRIASIGQSPLFLGHEHGRGSPLQSTRRPRPMYHRDWSTSRDVAAQRLQQVYNTGAQNPARIPRSPLIPPASPPAPRPGEEPRTELGEQEPEATGTSRGTTQEPEQGQGQMSWVRRNRNISTPMYWRNTHGNSAERRGEGGPRVGREGSRTITYTDVLWKAPETRREGARAG